jgi:hypothetical protein
MGGDEQRERAAAVATARTWMIKGVSDRTWDAVDETTRAERLAVGDWVDLAQLGMLSYDGACYGAPVKC